MLCRVREALISELPSHRPRWLRRRRISHFSMGLRESYTRRRLELQYLETGKRRIHQRTRPNGAKMRKDKKKFTTIGDLGAIGIF